MRTRPGPALVRTFGIPALIAAMILAGLLSGLLGDGVYDWISWIGLAAPGLAFILVRRSIKPDTD
jgi:hypothetical protein